MLLIEVNATIDIIASKPASYSGVHMFKKHDAFEPPEDENVKIWRYIDFTKLVSLIDRKALFFSKAVTLAEKGDKFEGLYPTAYFEEILKNTNSEHLKKTYKRLLGSKSNIREYIVINCWHINKVESAAMWKLYAGSGRGIAIQSTYNKLVESFHLNPDDVFIGIVKYIEDTIPFGNMFYPFLYKRKYFEHEQELRAMTISLRKDKDGKEIGKVKNKTDKGEYVPVDLDTLIEKIYISPTSEPWFYELVNSIDKKFEINKEVIRSKLSEEPKY